MFKKFSNLYLSVVWYYLAISAFGMFSHRIQETCSVTSSKENRNDLDDADVRSTTAPMFSLFLRVRLFVDG